MKKALKFKFDLNCKFAVYVPSTVNVDEKVDNKKYVQDTQIKLSQLFGGSTTTPAVGGWVDATGKLVIESVNIVYAFCTSKQAEKHFQEVIKICEDLKNSMKQEAISLEYNGQLKFI